MYTIVRYLPLRRLLSEQVPIIALSFVIAEVFYKFHSFTLECAAFLATWFALDFLGQSLQAQLRRYTAARRGERDAL